VKNETKECGDVMKAAIDLTIQTSCQALLSYILLLLAGLAWPGSNAYGQETTRGNQVYLLPPSTGEALTLAPKDLPDIRCSILDWKDDPPKPTLAILCPPPDTFAPVYLYLKLSWLKNEDVPSTARNITAPAKTVIKIRTTKSAAWVWLGVKEKPGASPRQTWVAFNALADIALLTLPSKE
jgi:hypothetical protein